MHKQKLVIPDSSNQGNDILAEINWNRNVERKYIRLTIGDKVCIVKKDHLYSILFMLGDAKEQEKIISPFIKQTRITKFTKMIGITTGRDIKKGEFINVLLEFTLNPDTGQVVIGKGSKYGLRKNLVKT
jgi:hypothetical protein